MNNVDEVYIAAARVGGILANKEFSAEFIYENLSIQNNLIHGSHLANINKLLFLGSSCIYPKFSQQPISEESLLQGKLEETNEAYAIAKIAGIKMCESYNRQYGRDYRSVMPTNLYGPYDNFHSEYSHVIPALIRKFHEAKLSSKQEVVIWGTGKAKREFLHVDDMASGCVHLMNLDLTQLQTKGYFHNSHINIGTGNDIEIINLAKLISDIVGYEGEIELDLSKPDGTPRKVLNTSLVNGLGWESTINIQDGIRSTYQWFLLNQKQYRGK